MAGGADDEGDLPRLQPGAVRRRRPGWSSEKWGPAACAAAGRSTSVVASSAPAGVADPHGQRHGAVTRRLVGDAVLVGEAGGRTAVEAGQGGGIGDRRHAAAAGGGQPAEHGAVALVGDELDHVGRARRSATAWSRVAVLAVSPPSDSRTIARSRASAVNWRAGEDDRVVQRGLSGCRQLGDPRREQGPVGGRAGDERRLRPEGRRRRRRMSGGSDGEELGRRRPGRPSIGAPTMLPDVSTTSMISRLDVGDRLDGVVDRLAVLGHLEGRRPGSRRRPGRGAVTTAVTAG